MHSSARRVVTQMVGAHGSIDIIKDIVDAKFQPVRQHSTRFAKVVRGVDAPYLIAFAVTIVFIETFAATSRRQADT